MMDDQRARELIALATKLGADEAVIVQDHVARRVDRVAGRQISHALNTSDDIAMFCAVGDAESSFIWNDKQPTDSDDFKQQVKNIVQAAKLANVWGVARKHVPFAEHFCKTSAQNCHKMTDFDDGNRDSCPKNSRVCLKDCFHPDCMADTALDAAPILTELVNKLGAISKDLELQASQTIREIRRNCWNSDGFVQMQRYETELSQTLVMHDIEEHLDLPDYIFDGAGIFPDDDAHKQMLAAADIAPDLLAKRESDVPDNLFGVLLSPWMVALLAHLSSHLNIDVTKSGKLLQNFDTCLFCPPDSGWCRSRALVHSTSARPTLNLLFARTSSHALYVDAPTVWIQRNQFFVDIQCRIAAEIDERRFNRFFRPVTLRFDLRDLWQYCTETAEPSRRMMLKCGNNRVVYQTPYAYFPIRPVMGRI